MTSTPSVSWRRRGVGVGLWVVQILTAAMLVNSAVQKLLGNTDFTSGFAALGFGEWFMYVVAALELAAGVAVLVPPLAGPAAWGLAAMMCGAVVSELTVMHGSVIPALNVLVMAILIAWGRHRGTEALLTRIRRG